MNRDVFGTSVRGASHIRTGKRCQDSFKCAVLRDGTVLMAAADGHGSPACPHSRAGAVMAAGTFLHVMREAHRHLGGGGELAAFLEREGSTALAAALEGEWKRRVRRCHRRLRRPVPRKENGEKDTDGVYALYGTTLLGLVIARDFVFAFQLGDGDICAVTGEGCRPLLSPERFLGVETRSLSCREAFRHACCALRRVDVSQKLPVMFTLSTDGFANSYPDDAAFRDALADYLAALRAHGAPAVRRCLGSWLNETSSLGCGDDVTMVIAYFSPEGEPCGRSDRE